MVEPLSGWTAFLIYFFRHSFSEHLYFYQSLSHFDSKVPTNFKGKSPLCFAAFSLDLQPCVDMECIFNNKLDVSRREHKPVDASI